MSASTLKDRICTLSCFEALRLLRRYQPDHPNLTLSDLVDFILKVDPDAHSLDMHAAMELHPIVAYECSLEGSVFYRHCIRAVLMEHRPSWSRTMRHGRKRFYNGLGRNDQDVFDAADLMVGSPPADVLEWWDEVSGQARLMGDQRKLSQGRSAEILTIEYEKQRLAKLGVNKEPEWPGLDDNFAGYDVLSYELLGANIVSRLIEVKSTTLSPMRFYISRNEWRQAQSVGERYIFHIWDMSKADPQLFVRTVTQVEPHIPADNGKGEWTSAAVPVGAST